MSVAGLRCRRYRLIRYSMEVAYGEKQEAESKSPVCSGA